MRRLKRLGHGFALQHLAAILAAAALLAGTGAKAGERRVVPPGTATAPVTSSYEDLFGSGTRPSQVVVRPTFDARDEAAALEAVQIALTEVGDGSTYVWYRHSGLLSGLVQPTQSFRDALGRVCRHIVVTLYDTTRSSRTEGIACRLSDGDWQLEG
ncbi:MAG: hypothetical protein JSS20_11320 [Proteobacteria bacterium]|nr:hypothetical protein [Pseudomonadota bacterium]